MLHLIQQQAARVIEHEKRGFMFGLFPEQRIIKTDLVVIRCHMLEQCRLANLSWTGQQQGRKLLLQACQQRLDLAFDIHGCQAVL